MGCLQIMSLVAIILIPSTVIAALSVTKDNITWTFNADYTAGQYANGDYYVVDPGGGVVINAIDPMSTNIAGRIQHGSMLNPINIGQGFDSETKYNTYTASLNVGRPVELNLSAVNPLIVSGGNSLVSTRTVDTPQNQSYQVIDASVLTIVTSAPVAGSFRPNIGGIVKYDSLNISQIDYTKLGNLDRSTIVNAPANITDYNGRMSKLWFDPFYGLDSQAYFHPFNNMPWYGGTMAQYTSEILLALQLDYSQADKSTALIQMLQYGIDIYGTLKNANCESTCTTQGGYYMGGGGISVGRQMPVVLTGVVLGVQDITDWGNSGLHNVYQEGGQHFYVTQADVDQVRYTADGRPRTPYLVADIGLAEWGEQHQVQPERDGSNWDAYYRDIVANASTTGHALTAHIMGITSDVGLPVMFDYIDRWHKCEAQYTGSCSTNYQKPFVEEMWSTFRDNYSLGYTGTTGTGTGYTQPGTGSFTQ